MKNSLLSLSLPLAIAGCVAPEETGFNDLTVEITEDAATTNALAIDIIDEAQSTLAIAFESLTDVDVAEAILRAADRGVEVKLVVDYDNRRDEGIELLRDSSVQLSFADDGIEYYEFTLNEQVSWPSQDTRMTHAFVIADRADLFMSTRAGDSDGGTRISFVGHSEDLGQDLGFEHVQVFGGSDAVATTFYDDMAKSNTSNRNHYPLINSPMDFQTWFGPQNRLVKRIIDDAYGIRSSIRVLTDDFSDEGLAEILQEKHEDGFDVEVIVGARFVTEREAGDNSRALAQKEARRNVLEKAPDVRILQMPGSRFVPTLVFYDFEKAQDGNYHHPHVSFATHEIYSASRLWEEKEVLTAQLFDSALYVLGTANTAPTPVMLKLSDVYADYRSSAEVLQ